MKEEEEKEVRTSDRLSSTQLTTGPLFGCLLPPHVGRNKNQDKEDPLLIGQEEERSSKINQ